MALEQLPLDPFAGPRGGSSYEREFDYERLNRQQRRVAELMADGEWRTLAAISTATGDPEASVSARLRDLRRPSMGGFTVERRRALPGSGTYQYRLLAPSEQEEAA